MTTTTQAVTWQQARTAPRLVEVAPLASADHRAAVPGDEAFADGEDYRVAPDLAAIGTALMARWPELAFLESARIVYLWKRRGGKSRGRDVYGQCQKPSGLLAHFAACDFIIWCASDHVAESGFTNHQLEALVFHELKHAWYRIDDRQGSPTEGEPIYVVRGHDDEVFIDEIVRYGAWLSGRRRAAEAWRQVPLEASHE